MLTPVRVSALRLATSPASGALGSLRSGLVDADDNQVLQIVALLDGSSEQGVTSALLDRLRPRLATLQPARKLRFDRLLFMPVNLLIVPPAEWQPQSPSIPRNVIASISATVLHFLGSDAAPILAMIRDRKTDDAVAVARAGALLWPRAAALLAATPSPVGWEETGLRTSLYPQLATIIAAILRMAIDVRALTHASANVPPSLLEQGVARLVRDLLAEGSEVQGMVLRLLLCQVPGAMPLLRRLIASTTRSSDKLALRSAMELGVDAMLLDLEGEQGLKSDLRSSTLFTSGAKATQLAGFLLDVEADPEGFRSRSRLPAIRRRLDEICRARFKDAIKRQILRPLESTDSLVDEAGQKTLEAAARDSKALEMSGRRFGNAAAYDATLAETAAGLRHACAAGKLTRMRKLRLLEILLGSDAAEAEYRLEQGEAQGRG